jgi:hypothetical protein
MVLAYSTTGKQAPEKQETKQAQKASNIRSQKKKADKMHNVSTLYFSTVHCRIFPLALPQFPDLQRKRKFSPFTYTFLLLLGLLLQTIPRVYRSSVLLRNQ